MKLFRSINFTAMALALSIPLTSAMAAETYYTDQGHTQVQFGWSHAGVSVQYGEFTQTEGILVLDPENIENSTLKVKIDAKSLSSGFVPLDNDLKSENYLDVETYPEITFTSTQIKQTDETSADVIGDLTIHGVTNQVTLKAKLTHRGEHPVASVLDYYRGQWIAFSATTQIDHQAFNVGNFSTGPISISIVTEMKDRKD